MRPPKAATRPKETTPRTEKGKYVETVPANPRHPPVKMRIPRSRSASVPPKVSRPEAVHATKVSLKRLQVRGDRDARELDVQRQPLISLPLPNVPVEGDDLVREVDPRSGDAIPREGECLGVDGPAVHRSPDLVRRERRDRSEESQEITEACVEGPTRTRVAFIRAGFHHLHIVRREQVPQELPAAVRGHEEVQVLVCPARGLHQMVQFREDPFVRRK